MEHLASKTLVYLWETAEKVGQKYPWLAAHELLKCRKLQGISAESLKASKFKSTSLCLGCGSPWALAKFHQSVLKRSAAKHRKLRKKSTKCPEKLSGLEKHLLARYQLQTSSLVLNCLVCQKKTSFSISAPTPIPKPELGVTKARPVEPVTSKNKKRKRKGIKETNAGLVSINNTPVVIKRSIPATPRTKNAIQAQKAQLNALLNAKRTSRGGLQDFLSSI